MATRRDLAATLRALAELSTEIRHAADALLRVTVQLEAAMDRAVATVKRRDGKAA
jgi:hypothetical protein